ncbi:hypothetical protein BN871_AM_00050 [Paenibacillus sp. P22]|nr:hypothetical protein BN871_AM_00050 [Paenibacillus sp. P22]
MQAFFLFVWGVRNVFLLLTKSGEPWKIRMVILQKADTDRDTLQKADTDKKTTKRK